jgi:uncharacterized paraquat-inducible protein A
LYDDDLNDDLSDDWIDEGPDDDIDGDLDDDHSEELMCPSCETMVHEDTQQCPQCGDWITPVYPSSATWPRKLWVVAVFLVLLAFLLMTIR